MIEDVLLNYGVLGLWTLSLLYERYRTQKQLKSVIERNTEALIKVHESINYCVKNKSRR